MECIPVLLRTTRFCLIFLCAVGSLLQAADEKPHFKISVFNLGVSGGTLEAEEVTAQIASDGWCTASVSPPAQRWNKCPDKVTGKEWIAVVLTGFGAQANAFAFIFDGPGGAPRLLAHVPYTIRWLPGGVKKWIPPVNQITDAIRVNYGRPTPATRARANIKVSDWQGAEEKTPAGVAPPAATTSFAEAQLSMEVMLCAAMCECDFAPTWEPAQQSLRLELRSEFKSASMRFTKQSGDINAVRKKERISEDHYYGFLKRQIYLMKSETGIADFGLPAGGHFRLQSATADRVIGVGNNGPIAFDPRTGKRLWPTELTTTTDAYAFRFDDAGVAKLFRYSRGLASVDLNTGAQKALSAESPGTALSFAAREDGVSVVARGAVLSAHRNAKEMWRKEEVSNITAGPYIMNSVLFAGTADGDLICENAEDGADKWRKNFGSEICGSLAGAGDTLIAFTKTNDALLAINGKDGSVLWKQNVGDVLLKSPARIGERWLVAGKNNRIMVLNAADGKVAAEVRWPTWLVDVLAAKMDGKSVILCTDIGGRLSVLDSADLKTLREVKLPARLSGEIVHAPQFPSAWGAARVEADALDLLIEDTDTSSKPAILVTDSEGYLYIVRTK